VSSKAKWKAASSVFVPTVLTGNGSSGHLAPGREANWTLPFIVQSAESNGSRAPGPTMFLLMKQQMAPWLNNSFNAHSECQGEQKSAHGSSQLEFAGGEGSAHSFSAGLSGQWAEPPDSLAPWPQGSGAPAQGQARSLVQCLPF
jgi:hypothetical protein